MHADAVFKNGLKSRGRSGKQRVETENRPPSSVAKYSKQDERNQPFARRHGHLCAQFAHMWLECWQARYVASGISSLHMGPMVKVHQQVGLKLQCGTSTPVFYSSMFKGI